MDPSQRDNNNIIIQNISMDTLIQRIMRKLMVVMQRRLEEQQRPSPRNSTLLSSIPSSTSTRFEKSLSKDESFGSFIKLRPFQPKKKFNKFIWFWIIEKETLQETKEVSKRKKNEIVKNDSLFLYFPWYYRYRNFCDLCDTLAGTFFVLTTLAHHLKN